MTATTRARAAGVLASVAALVTVLALAVGSGGGTAGADPATVGSTSDQTLGAGSLLVERPTQWGRVDRVDRMTPLPADAGADRPAVYDEASECLVRATSAEVSVCEWGDLTSDRVVAIVGDSKIVQWQPVLADLALDEGWKLVQVTKSGCAFTDAMRVRQSRAWTECRAWGRSALSTVIEMDPDLVLTSQRAEAAVPDDWPATGGLSQDLMVEGLVSYWSRIAAAGIPIAALLDNPSPPGHSVGDCVEQNPDELTRCAFPRGEGLVRSGAVVQLLAAQRVPEVGVLDMTDTLCPDSGVCPAVIGGVLPYREGSHLTTTFVRSARPQLAAALAKVSDGAFGAA